MRPVNDQRASFIDAIIGFFNQGFGDRSVTGAKPIPPKFLACVETVLTAQERRSQKTATATNHFIPKVGFMPPFKSKPYKVFYY